MRTPKNSKDLRVAIVYKNFASIAGISHIGLGVAALNNAKILERHGIKVDVLAADTVPRLKTMLDTAQVSGAPYTHMVISAPWIPTAQVSNLIQTYPFVEFFINFHSNVGFLQADPNALKLLREYLDLEQGSQNFHVAGNSKKFVTWVQKAYHAPCSYLPNMYFIDRATPVHKPPYVEGGTLRIGVFGAVRPQKNVITAAGAAIILANTVKADTEFWFSGGRHEGGGTTIVNAINQMLNGIPGIKVVEYNWSSWSQFRDTVRKMNLLIQMSYTESFNMVTADGIAEGVPSVVSEAIDWVPDDWQAHFDNADDIARVGRRLLFDPYAVSEGRHALNVHNNRSYGAWTTTLNVCDASGYRLQDSDTYIF